MHSIVYLPCELKGRDLDSRLLIAAHLVKAGCPVFVGQNWAITANIETSWKGCHLFPTVNRIKLGAMSRCKDAGHIVAASDEESMPFEGDRFLSNVDAEAMGHIDLFLAMRDTQRQILKKRFPKLRIKTTGTVRTDLLRLAKESRPIPEPYLLFNTNFALTNSVWGSTENVVGMLAESGAIDLSTDEGKRRLQRRYDCEVKSKEQLMALIRWCADTLPLLTIVRPHPAENANAWNEVKGKNLRVVSYSAPAPWIANAKLVIHSNSTTGLEAAIVGTPCLNISPPEYEDWAEQFVMRQINYTVADAQQAVPHILEFIEKGVMPPGGARDIPFLPDAGRRIADAICTFLKEKGATPVSEKMRWGKRVDRTQVETDKFTVSKSEFAERLEYVSQGLRMPRYEMLELDDSLIALSPLTS